jgi:hypothetical protein
LETFVKKYWDEEEILFYLHFEGEDAVRQIEVSSRGKVFLDTQNPVRGEAMLSDQDLSDLDLEESDFISKEEFEETWEEKR